MTLTWLKARIDEIQEAELVEAIKFAHTAIKVQCLVQKELTVEVGKTEKRVYSHEHSNEDLKKAIYAATYDQVYAIAGHLLLVKTSVVLSLKKYVILILLL
jgi:polyribonucleotide nucleotidyltransferase